MLSLQILFVLIIFKIHYCSASVTATFLLEDLTMKQFQRSVIGQSSDHKIDGQVSKTKSLLIYIFLKGFVITLWII